MYVGHLGIAMGARTVDRDVPILVYVAAAIAPDLLVARWFHLVAAAPILATVAASVVFKVWRSRRAAVTAALAVLSHYAVDMVTNRLAAWPGGERRGFEVYNRPLTDLVLEGVLIVGGWWLWQREREPSDRLLALSMLAALLTMQAGFSLFVADTLI